MSGQSCNGGVSRWCFSWMCLEANVLINVLVWAKVLFDSYEFKVSRFTRYGRTSQVWPAVGLYGSGQDSPPSPSGVAKRTVILQERRRVLSFSVTQGKLLQLHSSTPALLTLCPSAPVSIMSRYTPHSFSVPHWALAAISWPSALPDRPYSVSLL